MNYSIFVPVRAGSQRVPHKNTRTFANIPGGLVELKLRQLVALPPHFTIVLSTNDETAIHIAESQQFRQHIRVDRRPEHLCSSHVPLADVMAYVPTVCEANKIIWTHVTSPFMDTQLILAAVTAFELGLSAGYDSLMGVSKLQKYLWNPETGTAVNYDHRVTPWPSTQTLPILHEVNSSIFIADRSHYENDCDRIGRRPLLWETPYPGAVDIDWEEDFLVGEMLYAHRSGKVLN